MNQKWMNTLCRDIASQVVHNAIYPRLEEYDPQEALENIIKEVTNTLTNANWRQWTQEIIDSKSMNQ